MTHSKPGSAKENADQFRRIQDMQASIREGTVPDDPDEIAFFINDLATGHYDILEINNVAERELLVSLIIERDGISDNSCRIAEILFDLGRLCHDESRLTEAEAWYSQALVTCEHSTGEEFGREDILKDMIQLYRDIDLKEKAYAAERQLSLINSNYNFTIRPTTSVDSIKDEHSGTNEDQ